MENLNLNELRVREMSHLEIKETNGGGPLWLFAITAIFLLVAFSGSNGFTAPGPQG